MIWLAKTVLLLKVFALASITLFILPGQALAALTIEITNNTGHAKDDLHLFFTDAEGLNVTAVAPFGSHYKAEGLQGEWVVNADDGSVPVGGTATITFTVDAGHQEPNLLYAEWTELPVIRTPIGQDDVSIDPPTAADPKNVKNLIPSDSEKSDFAAKLARINAHEAYWTHDIQEVIDGLSDSGHIEVFDCPPSSRVDSVIINIQTHHIKWTKDFKLRGVDGTILLPGQRVGWYLWNPWQKVEFGIKKINAINLIMLDPAITGPDEKDPLYKHGDETLLYHELLHGQLLIDAMADPTWQQQVCNCTFDTTPTDGNHKKIGPLQNDYLAFIAVGATTYIKKPWPTMARADGSFDIEIVDESIFGTKQWKSKLLAPGDSGNVIINNNAVYTKEVTNNEGKKVRKIYVRGKLVDKTKPGFLVLRIDPPAVVLFAGIEDGIVILPYIPPTGSDKTWYVFVAGTFMISGLALLKRRRSSRRVEE